NALVKNAWEPLFWCTLFVLSVVLVSVRGLRAGLEPAVRFLVPILLLLLLALLWYASATTGFARALQEAAMPDFSKLGWTGVLAAVGHAFFSLSLGAS